MAASTQPELPNGHLRVLVVDDEPDNRSMMAALLRLYGHVVEVASDGPEALRVAEARPPDVVLLDVGMPGMNGYDAARRLREQANGRRMLLVAITGYGQPADRQRSWEAGMSLHLVKPVDVELLRGILESYKGT